MQSFGGEQCANELGVAYPPTPSEMARWALGLPLQWEPGSRQQYSNMGYLILGLVIEHVSQLTFEDAVHTYVTSPIGLEPGRVRVCQGCPEHFNPKEFCDPSCWYERGVYPANRAQGGIVADPAAVLITAANFQMGFGEHIGERRRAPGSWKAMHGT